MGACQVRYLWAVEGERRDVAVIDQNLLTAVWFTRMQGHLFADVVFPHVHGRLSVSKRTPTNFNCAQLLDANIARRPIFVVNGFKDDTWQGGYQLVPAGLVQRVLPRRAATGNAHAYNATRWLEDVIQGIGGIVGPAKRILTALRPRPDTVDGAHAACCVGSLVCAGSQGLAEGDGEAGDADSTCAVETQRDRGPAFEGMWRRRRGVRDRGFSRGSWEYKVQLELLAALQRVALHALQVLQAESGAVCATGVCLGPLEELAQALESALLRLADQPGIGAAYKNLGILYQRLLEMEPLSGAEGRMPHDEIAHAARRRIVDAVRRAWQVCVYVRDVCICVCVCRCRCYHYCLVGLSAFLSDHALFGMCSFRSILHGQMLPTTPSCT